MEGPIIKTHNFEAAKNQLKEFSRQDPKDLELSKVDISGKFFGLGDHKVTGYELNNLTTQIQNHLIDYNNIHIKLMKEFGQVYNALEALDKDYIQAILISIKAAERASSEAKNAQEDIAQTMKVQRGTINVLNQFKTKLESYKHLSDIDKLWNDLQESQNNVEDLYNEISAAIASIKDNSQKITTLSKFKDEVEKIKHLKNLDELWNKYEKISNEFLEINKTLNATSTSIDNQEQSINLLVQFKDKLDTYEHLEDIDDIWIKCNEVEKSVSSSKVIEIQHEEQINDLINSLQDIQIQNDERDKVFSKKLKLAYILSGGAIGIAALEFILLIMKVI